ncbi:MAG: sigma-70 family RNA polymerase sigma factor [Planctomycetes bacterium]|nr:sigma-70 family RNA polymerase sigma factor [Planctomycetota bacterium]
MADGQPFSELYERALSGDREAQADLYLRYGNHMRRCIAHRLKRLNIAWAVDPDDVFDSFFTRLIAGRVQCRFDSPLHFVNYCERALRNKCQDVLRFVILRKAHDIADCPPELLEDPAALDDLDQFTWDEQLERAYSQLTHIERVVCFLRAGGRSWSEISQRLRRSPDAIRMIHQRAAQRLGNDILAGGGGNITRPVEAGVLAGSSCADVLRSWAANLGVRAGLTGRRACLE